MDSLKVISLGLLKEVSRSSSQSRSREERYAKTANSLFSALGLNASYNCVDRWAYKHPDKIAIIWEADEPNTHVELSYNQLLQEVCRVANVLKGMGVKKGDVRRKVQIGIPCDWLNKRTAFGYV